MIDRSRSSGRLPPDALPTLGGIPGRTLEKIRIHDDPAAHEAAQGLGARAFTIGRSIYFGRGEYQPATMKGRRVLAHEAAHAHQQAHASLPPAGQLFVSSPSSREEADAERFADASTRGAPAAPPAQMPTGSVARLMRIRFTAECGDPITEDIQNTVDSGGLSTGGPGSFRFGWGADPYLFSWGCEVKADGTPEPGSDWRVGMIQLLKDYWFNIWWGDDAEAHCGNTFSELNVRDTADEKASPPWFRTFSDRFNADGESRSVEILDSPGALGVPYQNPVTSGGETFGRFNFGATYVTYVSAFNRASDEPDDSPERFQHLKHVYWQTMLAADFAWSPDPQERIRITDGGRTEVASVLPGLHASYPPKLAGDTGLQVICPIGKCYRPAMTCPGLQRPPSK